MDCEYRCRFKIYGRIAFIKKYINIPSASNLLTKVRISLAELEKKLSYRKWNVIKQKEWDTVLIYKLICFRHWTNQCNLILSSVGLTPHRKINTSNIHLSAMVPIYHILYSNSNPILPTVMWEVLGLVLNNLVIICMYPKHLSS